MNILGSLQVYDKKRMIYGSYLIIFGGNIKRQMK
jgi:hypothetical protein